jgi:hypothetical protein
MSFTSLRTKAILAVTNISGADRIVHNTVLEAISCESMPYLKFQVLAQHRPTWHLVKSQNDPLQRGDGKDATNELLASPRTKTSTCGHASNSKRASVRGERAEEEQRTNADTYEMAKASTEGAVGNELKTKANTPRSYVMLRPLISTIVMSSGSSLECALTCVQLKILSPMRVG